MALAYTDYMAAGGLLATSESVRDVSDVMYAILLKDTAALGQMKVGGNATNTKHEWVEDSLNAVTLTASYTAAGNVLTISSPATSAAVQKIVRTGALLATDGGAFMIQFATTPVTGANTMTVYANGTDADVASTTWTVLGMPYTDEAGLSDDIAKAKTIRWNSTQILERTMMVTKTRRGINQYGVGDGNKDFNLNIQNRTFEAKRELSMAVVRSKPYYDSGSGAFTSNTARHTMAGLEMLIRDPDLDGTDEDTTVNNAASADISQTLLDNLVYTVYNAGGMDAQSKPVLLMHHYQKQQIGAAGETIRRTTREDKTLGYAVESFLSTVYDKPIDIVVDRWMDKSKVILLDKSRCRLLSLKGDTWNLAKVPLSNSRMDAYQLSGQYTIELNNPEEAHGMIYGLATS